MHRLCVAGNAFIMQILQYLWILSGLSLVYFYGRHTFCVFRGPNGVNDHFRGSDDVLSQGAGPTRT